MCAIVFSRLGETTIHSTFRFRRLRVVVATYTVGDSEVEGTWTENWLNDLKMSKFFLFFVFFVNFLD